MYHKSSTDRATTLHDFYDFYEIYDFYKFNIS